MELSVCRWLPVLALVSCLVPVAGSAALDAAGTGTKAAPLDARGWLTRIHQAAATGNYQGTMVFTVGGTISSTRVGHYALGDQTWEQMEAQDGRKQSIVRHNDAVQTLWPNARVAVVERRETLAAWSTTPQEVDPQALEQYGLRSEGTDRVAGRDAQVFLLEPRDTLRYAQRLWADQATGLMLRADVIGLPATELQARGAPRPVLESTAFSEIAIGVKPQPDAVMQAVRSLRKLESEGWRIVRPQQQRTDLESEGWALNNPVPGFRLAGCVRRGMETAGDSQPVLQAVFTDGLTHVSLFIEPFNAQRHRDEMQAQRGATGTLMQRRGEHWITVVGDVPLTTLKLFAAAVDRRKSER